MNVDEQYMREALRQASRGLGLTSPNPAVGAVIVREGRIVGRGYHHRAGLPHAEIEALRTLRRPSQAAGATLYVTLEPCSTHGRTPPCVEAILAARLARVVVGAVDPNPAHRGRGLALLRTAGVAVESGLLATECDALNRGFNKWIATKMPWVIAKAGLSLDGRLTRPPGESQWLTSPASRADAQELRRRADAILIGAETLRLDNPHLTVREVQGAGKKVQPWRVVVTRGEKPLPPEAHLFTDAEHARTLVFTRRSLRAVLRELAVHRAVTTVLIEGGGQVLGEAFDRRLVDEVCFYAAPLVCGGPVVAVGGRGASQSAEAPCVREAVYQRLGDDIRMSGLVDYPAAKGQVS